MAAVLEISLLHDLRLVLLINLSTVIDRSNIYRERCITLEELQQNDEHTGMKRTFFDSRKDKPLAQVLGVDNKYHRKAVTEEQSMHHRILHTSST